MLGINISDVVKVVQSCLPYLIGFAVVAVIAIIVRVAVRKKDKATKKMVSAQGILASLLALGVGLNLICLYPMSTLISLATGDGSISAETSDEARAVAVDISREGIVMLKNEQNNLPMEKSSNLNVFGWASTCPVYGGTGSGGLNMNYSRVTLLEGLENAGFKLNTELSDFYTAYAAEKPKATGGIFSQNWSLPEPPAKTYPQELIDNAKAFSGNAVIVVSRIGGEGTDLPTDMASVEDGSWQDGSSYHDGTYEQNSDEYIDFPEGTHILELSQSEKDMVDLVCKNFDNVTVVYNGANTMELGWVDEHPQIKSVLWCPGTGQSGFNALGEILCGDVNPSAKTADTFVYDLTKTPTWNNFGNFVYDNMSEYDSEFMFGTFSLGEVHPSFINYTDNIYVGYRFYETAAAEGFIDYDKTVQYPFGYGLSYTTFKQDVGTLTEQDGVLSVDVTVTNTGNVAGKDVVEVYYNPPYTNGGIEKSSANLAAFDKTDLLEPGTSQTLTLTFNVEDMASYDVNGAGCYVLEAGDYIVSVNSDSHNIIKAQTYTVDKTVTYDESNPRQSDDKAATNLFGYADGGLTYLSRADHFANWDEATAGPSTYTMPADQKAQFLCTANYDATQFDDPSAEAPTMGAKNGLKLNDLRGLDYDDPKWDLLLDQMSADDMDKLVSSAGYQTQAIDSVGKVHTVDCDGPASINNNFTQQGSIGFPAAVMIANTWNVDMAHAFGDSIGKMADEMDVSGWYAPAMNTHRSAFGGRNFEYYSEDGVLAGNMAANAVIGAKEHGVYAYIKHFAMNDQETRRTDMLCTWANEQAMREIYFKPFEIAVKTGGTTAVMSAFSYIGPVYAAGTPELMQTVLRDEWGFRGMVISDGFSSSYFQNADQVVRAGNDACLVAFDTPETHMRVRSNAALQAMRTACHNIMYTVVNSRAYQYGGAEPMPKWKIALIAIDVVAVLCLAFCEYKSVKNYKKRKTEKAA